MNNAFDFDDNGELRSWQPPAPTTAPKERSMNNDISPVRAAFVVGKKTFDHKRDAEVWAAAVPRIKACEAYRFIKHLSPQTCGPRPQFASTEDCAPHGIYLRFADKSSINISIRGEICAYAPVSHRLTSGDDVRWFSSCCFLSNGVWEA